ncbi:MAG: hypothetical protein KIT72_18245 [Polyangiaceae bacterium]|nr:hypothetical protein [Polyangiaceae bacterium]MCW5792358.1 hypothetical protein [Polyangiaceae bacterium]
MVAFQQSGRVQIHDIHSAPKARSPREVHVPLDEFLQREAGIATLAVQFAAGDQSTWSDAVQVIHRERRWEILPPDVGATVRVSEPTEDDNGELPWDGHTRAFEFPGRTPQEVIQSARWGTPLQPSEVLPAVQSPRALTTVCFKQVVLQTGAGVGEDVFSANVGQYRSSKMMVHMPGYYFGILDANGCTSPLDLPGGDISITAFPFYVTNSRVAFVETWQEPSPNWPLIFTANIPAGGTYELLFWPISRQPEFNIGLFAITGLQRWPGPNSGEYHFLARAPEDKNAGGSIHIKSHLDKTLVGHELGHAFFSRNTSVSFAASDYSIADAWPCNAGGVGGHDIDSTEYAQSTFTEAVATYYAAVSWNYRDQDGDCWLYHPGYPTGVNCDGGQTALPLAFMKNKCSPWTGRGVEIDWLRALWNIRTSGAKTSDNSLLNWIDAAPNAYTLTNTYSNLDAAANTMGGALNTNWDTTKVTNGLNP